MNALVGKYFIGVYDGCTRSGIVEAAIDPRHYLVRFDDVIGFTHGSEWPASLAVVPLSDMTLGGLVKDEPPPWTFFDDKEQRVRYEEWLNGPRTDRTPRLVPPPKSK